MHAERAHSGRTDWPAIAAFYDRLTFLTRTVGAAVGRAAAHAKVGGPAVGLSMLDQLATECASAHQPYMAVRAHLLGRLGQEAAASATYDQAIELTADEAVRGFLLEGRNASAAAADRLTNAEAL